jgi:hypothetical protein
MTVPIIDQLRILTGREGFQIIDNLGGYVSAIVSLLLTVAALAAFIYLVLGGIKYITAGGDKGKVEEAKTSITHAITGLTIVAASWAIFLVLNHFFGLGMVGGARNIPGTTPPRTSNPPPGYCLCGNGGCTNSTAKASRGTADGQCYQCDPTTGGWNKLYKDPAKTQPDLTCRTTVISCPPCPQ